MVGFRLLSGLDTLVLEPSELMELSLRYLDSSGRSYTISRNLLVVNWQFVLAVEGSRSSVNELLKWDYQRKEMLIKNLKYVDKIMLTFAQAAVLDAMMECLPHSEF